METLGLIMIVGTALLFAAAGIFYSKKRELDIENIEQFVIARNHYRAGALTATIVATSMGAWILFSPAEATAVAGIMALIGYALGSAAAVFIFIWVGKRLRELMPQGHTLTEYVWHRFGKGMYALVLIVTVLYMGVYLAAELTAIAVASQMVFGIPLILTATVVALGVVTYTAMGGLKAVIFTDMLQFSMILPLLAILFVTGAFLVRGLHVVEQISTKAPELLSLTHLPGIEYGLTLIVAIIGAELFNQTNWQRVFAAQTTKTMQRSFFGAGLLIIPIILAAGLFGLFAVAHGDAQNPSVSLFTFLLALAPGWLLVVTLMLAVVLVMSSMDSLLNGLVSLFTVDLVRLYPKANQQKMLSSAKWFTLVLAGLTVLVAIQGYSVLYLFLIADLICLAAAVPTIFGLYAKRYTGLHAFLATIAGIGAGAAFFPSPDFSTGSLFWSFVIAALVPLVLSLISMMLTRTAYDYSTLRAKVIVWNKNNNQ
ncbi:hypothetical protein HYW21_01125 [Candidatus Woesearchaeota archaeon]|nr:hypothetical protein [Candidatus Woesearchaeota archaeon]